MTDYIRLYKKFISSHHFYEGVRMTAGVMAPVLVMVYYGQMALGVMMALGALGVSITDNPGPIHHRRNGMLFTIGLLFFTTIITGLSVPHAWLVCLLLIVLPFLFSIIGVYGTRTTSIGIACMLVMMLNIDKTQTPQQVLQNALLTVAGGVWYFLLSITIHQLRPYKLLQQVLGDCMLETANYLRIKASFYDAHVDLNKSYHALTESQVQVHNKQQAAREILFKTRSIVKESTQTGRILVMAFIDILDLFERIMTSQQEYSLLHKHFKDTVLLKAFLHSILQLASDLDELGIAFQEGRKSNLIKESAEEVQALEDLFVEERSRLMNDNNTDAFISLRYILNSIKDLQSRIDTLHNYSGYNLKVPRSQRTQRDYRRFVARSDYNPKILIDNLNIHSNIFRHSVRVSLALLLGYALSWFLPIGHDYWILLTIIVILKPGYALTRQRNFQRLAGTIAGAATAAVILYFIKETHVLVAIIIIFMISAYSLMRVNYLFFVFFMTAYILTAFHFLKPGDINAALQDRIVDTAIGSVISLVFTFIIPPRWEHENIISLCSDAIRSNTAYFEYIALAFTGKELITSQYKLKRKEAFVALANLSDAFQRMLNEPKSKQQNGEDLHQLIVSNHVLASHIATLSAYRLEYATQYISPNFQLVIDLTVEQLKEAENLLLRAQHENHTLQTQFVTAHEQTDDQVQLAIQQLRQGMPESAGQKKSVFKTITDQFEIILRVAGDLKGICKKLTA